jgi:hypothetical protein
MSVLDDNELEGVLEDPLRFTKADSRFFYIKTSGSDVALEAMNGKTGNTFGKDRLSSLRIKRAVL